MQEERAPNDELTINEFNEQIKILVHFIRSIIYQYCKGFKRYWFVMTSLLIVITAGGLLYFSHAEKKFEGKASYEYTSLKRKLYGEAIDNVNALIQTKSYLQLQDILPVSVDQLEHIREIKATNNYGSILSDDMTENNSKIFYISVKSTDHAVFDSLAITLENYLNNIVAVRELQQQRIEKFKRAITYREKELIALDSLMHAYTNSLSSNTQSVYPVQKSQINTEALFEKGEKITEEIADMQSFLQDPRAVKLQEPFLVSQILLRKSVLKIAAVIIIMYIVVSGLLLFILLNITRPEHVPE
ncbi:hypothetical protein SAMN05518672_11538 [Chitinophaga sp. CF118]|uniref:hypothetical protein n=1 Tax=Chitinophaga sp. CF118 TaxID=1884367 RepID=UPI0008E8EC21|nr:hypothetical protein [Chitinophaga sp. CF118]SFF06593.1 hypothetical protein SAMN05518672_11538 [Chitinophaga sp. CF118]